MPLLHHRPRLPRLSLVQPGMPALRSAHPAAPGPLADKPERVQGTSAGDAQGLVATWPLRDAHQAAGGWTLIDWPGRTCGIRAPDFGENPLSHAEVAHAVRFEILDAGTPV